MIAVQDFLRLSRRRGMAIAKQTGTITTLLQSSPVDVSSVIAGALVISQGMALGQINTLTWLMNEADYPQRSLNEQFLIGQLVVLWQDLYNTLRSLVIQHRIPALESLQTVDAAARVFGSNARGVATGMALEDLLSPATVAGIGLPTFWVTSLTGRAAIGRLVSMDDVLTHTYEYDPLTEARLALQEMTPLAPEALPLIRAIEAVAPKAVTADQIAQGTRMVVITEGMDLMALASVTLSSPDAWRSLVSLNSLRYPYISSDPRDQLGDPLSEVILDENLEEGATTARFVSVTGLYADQQLVFDLGVSFEQVRITGIVEATRIVQFTPALTRGYNSASTLVRVHAPEYDIKGVVLKPGDVLLLPTYVTASTVITHLAVTDILSPESQVYGVDVLVSDQGRLVVDPDAGDLAFVEGRYNLVQALRNRFRTPKGSLTHHQDYGFGALVYIGLKHRSVLDFAAVVEGRDTVLHDPRIASVTSFEAVFSGDTLSLTFDAQTSQDQQFPGITISVPLRG